MVLRKGQDKKTMFRQEYRTSYIQYKFYYESKENSQIRKIMNKQKLEAIKILIDNNKITYAKRHK